MGGIGYKKPPVGMYSLTEGQHLSWKSILLFLNSLMNCFFSPFWNRRLSKESFVVYVFFVIC